MRCLELVGCLCLVPNLASAPADPGAELWASEMDNSLGRLQKLSSSQSIQIHPQSFGTLRLLRDLINTIISMSRCILSKRRHLGDSQLCGCYKNAPPGHVLRCEMGGGGGGVGVGVVVLQLVMLILKTLQHLYL